MDRLLRTPLLSKMIALDVVVNVAALVAIYNAPSAYAAEVNVVSIVLVLILNGALVAWALSPLQVLEETARRVSDGDFGARAQMPVVADRNLIRIGDTLNTLIDRVSSERERVRALATELVAAGDRERAQISRELHDGTAQSLSALDMLIGAALADPAAGPMQARLQQMHDITAETLREVRTISQNMHPRVLDDVGLAAALDLLGRRMEGLGRTRIEVQAQPADLPPAVASVLYRVAQEALSNAVKHAGATVVQLRLDVVTDAVRLRIEDDGVGFDASEAADKRRGLGLFIMAERVSLVDGRFALHSAPGSGTKVTADIPLV